jgi:aminopeptidase-like protein
MPRAFERPCGDTELPDGAHALLDIADRAAADFATIRMATDLLERHGLRAPL